MNTGRRERGRAVSLLLCFLLSLGALLGTSGTVLAQERTGTLTGVATDASGGVLPGVTVNITNNRTGRVTTLTTDGAGRYRADLDPGNYKVSFELSGFARQELPEVDVQLGRTFDVNAQLKVGNVTEAVQVTAENTPLVDTRSTIVAHNVTAEEIDRMPKGRSFQSIALAAPSVNTGEIEGGFQVNGASGSENAFTVDGVNTTSLLNGSSRQDTVFEYIQEVQVKTVGIPAEYGGALGGVISAVTKSGGNIFSGEGHYYFSGSPLSAGPVKRLVLSPIDDKTVTYVQDDKMPEHRNEIGGSLGGPIVRDKLFFFGSFSPRFVDRTNEYNFSSGTEQGDIKRTQKYIQGFGKVSFGSRRVNAYGTVLATPTYDTGVLIAYNGITPNTVSASNASADSNRTVGWETMQVNTTGNVDIVISNGAYATFRGGYFHDRYADTGISDTTSYTYQTVAPAVLSNGATLPSNIQGPINTVNVPRLQRADFDTTKRTTFNADYNHTFQGSGWHTLKGGFGYQHVVNDVNTLYPGGYVYIYWDRSTNLSGQTPDRGTYGYYEVNNIGTTGKVGGDILSLYVQDQWQLGDRLTLNLGIRTEDETIPTFTAGATEAAIDFSFADKIAPRLGASYDLFGNGRAKIYGSYGRYYDWTKYELARGSFGGDIWCIYYRAIDDPNVPLTANWNNAPGRDLWRTPGGCRDRRGNYTDNVDPAIKPMSQDSYSAGFDFEVNPRTVATVHYVHNHLIRTIEDLGGLVNGNEEYIIGNPGEGMGAVTPPSGLSGNFDTPKAKRQYDAVDFGLSRRFANNWFASANLTISRLWGNYPGIASSDEIRTPTTGTSATAPQQSGGRIYRQGGNANRAWDLDEVLFDSHGNLDVTGRLATDRPVVLKLYGAYNFARNTQVGLFFYGGSGTPMTTYVNTTNQTEAMVEGRGDMGRTPFYNKTDLLVSHELQMQGSKRLRFELNVLNLFNQKTARHLYNYLNRGGGAPQAASSIALGNTNLFKGYDYRALLAATTQGANAYDPRYGMDDLFEPGTQGQFTIKFLF